MAGLEVGELAELREEQRRLRRGLRTAPLFGNVVDEGEAPRAEPERISDLTARVNRTLPREEDILAKLGISSDIVKDQRMKEALARPQSYLQRKLNDRVRMADQLATIYNQELNNLLESGMATNKAEKQALSNIRPLANSKRKQHLERFPVDIVKSAQQSVQNRGVEE